MDLVTEIVYSLSWGWVILGVVLVIIVYANVQSYCEHDWEMVKDTLYKSHAEVYGEATGRVPAPRNNYALEEMSKRKSITILKCKKCGKLDKTIEYV
ncbi:hypothetical protein VPHD479_0293 [Vibrio phage D479]